MLTDQTAGVIRNILRTPSRWIRYLLVALGVLASVSFYIFLVERYSFPNLVDFVLPTNKQYKFYSGSGKVGFYSKVGMGLADATKPANKKGFGIEVVNKESNGGSENAIQVLLNRSSFGLVQEDTVKPGDFIRDKVQYVTPLYLERMHILYNTTREGSPAIKPITLSSNTERAVLEFFANARISSGPVGSGTRELSSYVLSEINRQIAEAGISERQNRVLNIKSGENFDRIVLANEESLAIDILFTVAGAPLPSVRKSFENPHIAMISIDPSLVADINRHYSLNLRMADFRVRKGLNNPTIPTIYGTQSEGISTLGTYAFLVASEDVPDRDKLELLRILDIEKGEIKKEMGIKTGEHFQLEEFAFYESYEAEYKKLRWDILRSLVMFVVTVFGTFIVTLSLLVWVVSVLKQGAYFADIEHVYRQNLTDELQDQVKSSNDMINQTLVSLENGINTLRNLDSDLIKDYRTGGITDSHYRHLLAAVDRCLDKMKEKLTPTLYAWLALNSDVEQKALAHYFETGLIDRSDFRDLEKRYFPSDKTDAG